MTNYEEKEAKALDEYLTTPGWGQPVSDEEMTDDE